jgi:hypothetical protein
MSSPADGLQFTIRLMDGGLAVGLVVQAIPEVGTPEALAEVLMEHLKKRNIVYGLNEDEIRRVIRDRVLNQQVEVAHGTPPRPGRDAEIEMVLLPPSFMAQAGEDGRVDYKNIKNVAQVKAGDVISRKIPSDPGEPGVNVFGKPIRPPAVRDARHPAGRNTAISEDGLEMAAAKDGFLRWNDDKIDVVELYAVKGDVDLHTGNIRYDKDVEIFGSVLAGFEVVGGGDVRIYGNVDGGKVVSLNGRVKVDGGVLGSEGGPGVVTAEGDVQIGRARFAQIESKSGSVIANFAVEHSEIRAAGDLILRAGPAMSCVVQVGGAVDVTNVSRDAPIGSERPAGPAMTQSSKGNRRAYVRIVLSPPIKASIMGDVPSETREGTILNMSAGGVKLSVPEWLKEGDRHRIQFALEGVPGTMWMEAEVVRTCEPLAEGEPAGGGRSYGLKFVHIEPAVREAIARYCLAEDLRQHRLTKAG